MIQDPAISLLRRKLSAEEQRAQAHAQQVSCPACQAVPDQACTRRDRNFRWVACSPHKERVQRAEAYKGLP